MDLTKLWVIVVFIICYEQFSIASNVNVLNKNDPGRSRPKKSANADIYLALPPENVKTGKEDSSPTLIRLEPNVPNKFRGKFPAPIERFIQRIQNYFSVYNPPEYLNDLRPGINNSENDGDQIDNSNDTQIILPCNGTSTIVIIPVPLENEISNQNTNPDKSEGYKDPTTQKPYYFDLGTSKPPYPEEETTTKAKCPEAVTTPKPNCPQEITTPKPNCPEEVTTTKPKCHKEITTQKPKCPEEVTTIKPKCPEEITTTKPLCPEVTTPKQEICTEETTTSKPKCPEVTTPKPKCPEVTTPKSKCPEVTSQKPQCLPTPQKPICPPRPNTASSDPKPISGYSGPNEVPPLNLVAQPVVGSSVFFYYKNLSTSSPDLPLPVYYVPNTQAHYEVQTSTRRPKPPLARLKQLLFPRLYAAFHPEDQE
ncbi:extensin-like [Sipha flava]|uniref:Extensin-like n=2 Tax=Sipha flava TaxID=143950 RepID=A0A8B8FZS3_9HEMI|nr:extensin-like [Sipha flava]